MVHVGQTSAPAVRIVLSPERILFLPCAQKAILYAGWRQLGPWRVLGSLPYQWQSVRGDPEHFDI